MIAFDPLVLTPLGLVQTAAAMADTVVTVPASPTGLQRWVELMTSISSIVIAVMLVAIAIPLVPAAWNSRKMYRRINRLLDWFEGDVQPIVKNAHQIADNLSYVSTAVRSDLEVFRRALDGAQGRLTRAAAQTEERIGRFNALLEVVQEEAEQLFIDTASTMRGVQAGARALRGEDGESLGEELPEERNLAGSSRRPRRHP